MSAPSNGARLLPTKPIDKLNYVVGIAVALPPTRCQGVKTARTQLSSLSLNILYPCGP
jgi:hypothetical protein